MLLCACCVYCTALLCRIGCTTNSTMCHCSHRTFPWRARGCCRWAVLPRKTTSQSSMRLCVSVCLCLSVHVSVFLSVSSFVVLLLVARYCMPYPRHALQSVEIPAVTQVSVAKYTSRTHIHSHSLTFTHIHSHSLTFTHIHSPSRVRPVRFALQTITFPTPLVRISGVSGRHPSSRMHSHSHRSR